MLVGNWKGRDHLGDQGVDGIIMELTGVGWRMRTGFI
jgi:hypothetical protein